MTNLKEAAMKSDLMYRWKSLSLEFTYISKLLDSCTVPISGTMLLLDDKLISFRYIWRHTHSDSTSLRLSCKMKYKIDGGLKKKSGQACHINITSRQNSCRDPGSNPHFEASAIIGMLSYPDFN